MAQVSTTKEAKTRVRENVMSKLSTPSIYVCWDPASMNFHAHRTESGVTRILGPSDIERFFYQGLYVDSDMFLIRAMHCLTFASCESLWALVRFWYHEEVARASEEKRGRLAVPCFEYYYDCYGRIRALAKYGLVCWYEFTPEYAASGRERKAESVYKASGHAIGFYKKKLLERDMPSDPLDAYCNPEDIFMHALNAQTLTAFLGAGYVRNVKFKQTVNIGNRRHKIRAYINFNEKGLNGDKKDDTTVIFEGMTFRTNENLVKKSTRYEANRERIREVSAVLDEFNKQKPTFLVVSCEDAAGVQSAFQLIKETAPDILTKCFFTSGNVIAESEVHRNPAALKNCFLGVEKNGNGYYIDGAAGYYFLESTNDGISLNFHNAYGQAT